MIKRLVINKQKEILDEHLSNGDILVKSKQDQSISGTIKNLFSVPQMMQNSSHKSQIEASVVVKDKMQEAYDSINVFDDP